MSEQICVNFHALLCVGFYYVCAVSNPCKTVRVGFIVPILQMKTLRH